MNFKDLLICEGVDIPRLYLVGGAVRDLLLGRPLKDLDLVCRGARDYASRLAQCKGAALVPMEKKPDEPCYRVIVRDRPDDYLDIAEIRGQDILEDLGRRDFTINAMAVEINSDCSPGRTIDPLAGAEDLRKKIIRLANKDSLTSDPLRVLRGFRFAAALGFDIADSTVEGMRKSAGLLSSVSAERIIAELFLILKNPRASFYFSWMDGLGIPEIIIPEVMPMKGCEQNGFHHKDVWGHSMLVMEKCEKLLNNVDVHFGSCGPSIADNLDKDGRAGLLKLAALLHDIGKPATKGINADTGRTTFYGHDREGAKVIDIIAQRLKMSNADREFLVLLAAEHMHALNLSAAGVKASTKMRWFRRMRDDSVPALILAVADVMSSLGPESGEEYREGLIERCRQSVGEYFTGIKEKIERPSFVNGDDLISLGVSPGPELGRLLEQLRSMQDTGEINRREEGLEAAVKLIAAGRLHLKTEEQA